MQEVSAKDDIIRLLQKQVKELESSYKKEAAKREELDASYKKQLESVKKGNADDESLQDKLDDAVLKIKQLEAEAAKKGGNANDSATIKRLNVELSQVKADLDKADKAYEDQKKEIARLKESYESSAQAGKDTNTLAVGITNSLAEIGIQVEPVASNGELVLRGFSDNIQLAVNVDGGVLYVEMPVKSGAKYRSEFEKWNKENIRISYLFEAKKVICKCTYDEVAKAALDIIGRFKGLR